MKQTNAACIAVVLLILVTPGPALAIVSCDTDEDIADFRARRDREATVLLQTWFAEGGRLPLTTIGKHTTHILTEEARIIEICGERRFLDQHLVLLRPDRRQLTVETAPAILFLRLLDRDLTDFGREPANYELRHRRWKRRNPEVQ